MDTLTLLVFVFAALGFAVMAAEVMVPSLGLLSMLALVCFTGSTVCAWKAWYATGHVMWWWCYVFGMIVAIPGVLVGMFSLLPRTSFGRRIMVMPPKLEDVRPYVKEEQRLRSLMNQTGRTTCLLSPGGMVLIGGEKFHAESEGVLIEAATAVTVIGVRGNRLLVRESSKFTRSGGNEETIAVADEVPEEPPSSESNAIDFEIPDAT